MFSVPAVAFPADVNPARIAVFVALLVDELVEVAELLDELAQQGVVFGILGHDIRRFAAHVLAVRAAAHEVVELWAAVAAVDVDRPSVGFPQWVENPLHEGAKVLFHFEVRTVP